MSTYNTVSSEYYMTQQDFDLFRLRLSQVYHHTSIHFHSCGFIVYVYTDVDPNLFFFDIQSIINTVIEIQPNYILYSNTRKLGAYRLDFQKNIVPVLSGSTAVSLNLL